MEMPCGLLTAKNTPVPLRSISVVVEVQGFVADVTASLEYRNEETNPVEAVFVFPMDRDAAVYHFQATVDGKRIVAEIKEKEKAKDEYDDAVSAGHEAFLLEEDSSSSDIFTCMVGNLPPAQSASLSFSFVQELAIEADGAVRFVLPAVLNPRYTPTDARAPGVTEDIPRALGPPYTLALKAQVRSPLGVSRVQSNCGLSPLKYLSPDKTAAELSLTDGHSFNKDVELLIYYDNVHTPSAIVEAGVESVAPGTLMGDPTIMVNVYPSFPEQSPQVASGEFIFLLDRSGSMGGAMSDKQGGPTRIQSAKETLLLLLKSLPMGCFFNVYGFGSHFSSFFPESVEYNQESMQKALEELKGLDADMGGTEILQPLTAIYSKSCKAGHPRQLFVFTDGEVSNTKAVITEVRKHAPSHRCFSFGIGQGASTDLIKGIAKAASGSYEFITGKERMQPKVLQSLKFALQPAVTGLTVSWALPTGLEAVLLSQLPTVIFNGQRTILYAQLKGKVDPRLEAEMSLKYSLGEQLVQDSVKFKLQPNKTARSTTHRLAAKAMIETLDSGSDRESEGVKKRMIEISTQANVISSQTAFIAINRDLNQPLQGPMLRRDVPLYRESQWNGSCPSMPMANYVLRMALDCVGAQCPALGAKRKARSRKPRMVPTAQKCQGATASHRSDGSLVFAGQQQMPVMLDSVVCDEADAASLPAEESPLVKVVSQQNADGSWSPSGNLEVLLGLKPQEIGQRVPRQDMDLTLWVTILTVIWLHAFCADSKDEWELLVDKSLSWIKANSGADLGGCVKAGNDLLKTSVNPHVFDL